MYPHTYITVLTITVGALLLYAYITIKRKYNFWASKGISFIKPKFFVGNLELIRSKSFAEKTQELYSAFAGERYHGAYFFLEPFLVVKDPDLIKQITVKEFEHFIDHRSVVTSKTDPLWSKNLFTSQGERWRSLRSTLSPSFTGSKMRIMYNLIEKCTQEFVDYFRNETSQLEVMELEMKDILSRYTNDVIATTAFGLKCDSLRNKKNEFYLMGKEASDFGRFGLIRFFAHGLAPTLCQLLRIRIIPAHIADYFSKIIEDTLRVRQEKNIIRPDLIHLLMEAKKRHQQELTLEDITAQAFIFFLAGFETVSILLSFALYELAINPAIQNRLRKEIDAAPDKITYENLSSLKYLDMVISETLRKWPPVVATDREVTKAFTIQPERPQEKPLHLQRGSLCWIPIFALHHDPLLYPEPEKFSPERFNDENKHKIHSAVYTPFGNGPRNCIGSRFALLESKLLIFHLLKTFEVVPVRKTPIPVVLDSAQLNLTAKGGMWLGLKKYSNK